MRRVLAPIAFSLAALTACSGDSPAPGSSVIAVEITPDNPTVVEGTALAFKAFAISETGEQKDVSDSPGTTWLSSDTDVVTVNADGTGEAGDAGTSYVTARVSGVTSPAQLVTVTAAPTPTPTPTPPPIADHVVISELLYTAATDPGGEFIEIHNPTGGNIDISNWTLRKDGDTNTVYFTFPAATTIDAGAFIVVCNTPATCGIAGALDSTSASTFPATTGDWVKLVDETGTNVVDEMAYGSGEVGTKPAGWCADNNPAANATAGNSVQRKPTGGDSDVCTDWISNTAATGGAATL